MHNIIYSYHPETFEFLGPVIAQMSPLEPDVVLMTEGTTPVAPPEFGGHEAAIFHPSSSSWAIVPDFRGVALYSTLDGSSANTSMPGPLPENTTEKPRPSMFHDWHDDDWALNVDRAREYVWERIKAERDSRKAGGISVDTQFGLQWFHSDIDSRIQHLGLKDRARDMLAAGGTLPDGLLILGELVMWKTMGGTFVPITAQLAYDIVAAGADLDAQLFAAAERHRVAMEALSDPTQYDFSGGWPARFEV